MVLSLSPYSSLEILRSEAKRWLKAIAAGDLAAIARFRESFPDHIDVPKLRQVQHALARDHGFPSWAALKQEIEDQTRTSEDRVRLFLEKSVNRYGTAPSTQKWGNYERDGSARGILAARLLRRHPEIVRDSIHTAGGPFLMSLDSKYERFVAATMAGDLASMRELARTHPGFLNRHEVMFGIIRLQRADVAEALLDLGTSPDVGDDMNFRALHYTTHCGAADIARLLIARGAEIPKLTRSSGATGERLSPTPPIRAGRI